MCVCVCVCVCVMQDFAAMFGNPLKDKSYPLNFEQLGKPMCPTGIGCMFI